MSKILLMGNFIIESIDNIKFSTDKDFEYWKKNPYQLIEGLDIDWKRSGSYLRSLPTRKGFTLPKGRDRDLLVRYISCCYES